MQEGYDFISKEAEWFKETSNRYISRVEIRLRGRVQYRQIDNFQLKPITEQAGLLIAMIR